jgi:hypothetical protein
MRMNGENLAACTSDDDQGALTQVELFAPG